MLTYNTQLKKLVLPEYGRNIQKMVEHCLTIEDREERNRCASTIIKAMNTLIPTTGDPQAYRKKLYDHLAIMSDFKLDIDWPYEVIRPDDLDTKPLPLWHQESDIRYRHYGRNLEIMINEVANMPEDKERDALIMLLANQMKKSMLAVNGDGVDDARIFKDLRQMSHGMINLDPANVHLHEFKALAAPSKKKKKK